MATIGQALTTPEAGWKRYNEDNPFILYDGDWKTSTTTSEHYNGTAKISVDLNSKISFYFRGTDLRIICFMSGTRSKNAIITIDGVSESFTVNNTKITYQALVYEKIGMDEKLHKIEVINGDATGDIVFDAIDINNRGELTFPQNKMVMENSITNQYSSLSDDILIRLPNSSNKNIILYGIEKDTEVQLDVPFNKINYVNETLVINENKRIFTQDIEKVNTLKIKEVQ